MPDPLRVEYGRVRDEARLNRDGTSETLKVVPIFIGPHGPMVERFTQAEFADGVTVRNRVEQLRASLDKLPR